MFVACDKTNGDDDDGNGNGNGNGGGRTLTADEKKLVCKWVTGNVELASTWTYAQWTSNTFYAGVPYGIYQFMSDGKFLYRFRSRNSNGSVNTFLQWQGNFRVTGDKVIFSNVKENHINFNRTSENYDNKSLSGEFTYFYRFTKTSSNADAIQVESKVEDFDSLSRYWEKVE
jgi:hypothetical protein